MNERHAGDPVVPDHQGDGRLTWRLLALAAVVALVASCGMVGNPFDRDAARKPPAPGAVVYSADFTLWNQTHGAPRQGPQGMATVSASTAEYRIDLSGEQVRWTGGPDSRPAYGDVVVEADATISGPGGDGSEVSVFCRYRNGDAYAFSITPTGKYDVFRRYSDGSPSRSLTPPSQRVATNAIHVQGRSNHLRAQCANDHDGRSVHLTFSVNDHLLVDMHDSDLLGDGLVGVTATLQAHGKAEAVFSSFTVSKPG